MKEKPVKIRLARLGMAQLVEPKIAYVVMPPGHGKSVIQGKVPGLVEADWLMDCRGTAVLSTLRDSARETGDWTEYDVEYASELSQAISRQPPRRRWVIMLPHSSTGEVAGWEFLGAFCLTKSVWDQNLSRRKGSITKYGSCWDNALAMGATVFASNHDLEWSVSSVAVSFLTIP